MVRARRVLLAAGMAVALGLGLWAGSAGAGEDAGGGGGEAGKLVMRQIEALRAHDFGAAYALASRELRRHFSPGEFEWMVKRAHPELASSAYAFVVRTHETDGFVYVTVKIHGKNGKDVEALYEVVREGDALKVNAVSSRHDEGVF